MSTPAPAHRPVAVATAPPGRLSAARPGDQPPSPAPAGVALPQLAPCPGSWSIQASYPISVSEQAVAAQGDTLYSFGGDDGTAPLDTAYKYTPATNTWTAIAPLPAPRFGHQAVSDGTAIYILGGSGSGVDSEGTNTLWRYNPSTNTYTTLAPYLIPTTAHAAAYLDGKIYRIAGCTPLHQFSCLPDGTTNSVEVYTIATNAWAAAAPYPLHTTFLRAIGYNGYVYGAGGANAQNKTYRYDPATDRWDDAAVADLPGNNAGGAASALLNGRWVLAGGYVDGTLAGAIAWNSATNAWEPVAALPQGRWFSGGATIGSAFYVVGGYTDPGPPTNTNQRYLEVPCTTPTATPTGTLTTPMPTPVVCGVGHWQEQASIPTLLLGNVLVGQGGHLYSFGGVGVVSRDTLTATYSYDPLTEVWIPRAPLPAPRTDASAVTDGTSIYILGEDEGNNPTNSLWRYNPTTDTYTPLTSAPSAVSSPAAVFLNGLIYRIGGTINNGESASVAIYTIATNSWATVADYPLAVARAAAVALNGYIYVAGGGYTNLTNKTYRYDPVSNTWNDTAVTDLPQARWGAATGVYNGQWIIATGSDRSPPPYASALAWNPATNTWSNLPDLAEGRLFVAGTTLADGFYAIGGDDAYGQPTTYNQRYREIPCGATPTVISTPPTVTRTTTTPPTATPPATICAVTFADVPAGSTFYDYVRCLVCRGIVGGYSCGGPGEPCPGPYFRPNNNVTRGQVSKIVAESAGFSDVVPFTQQTFADVPPGSTFALWVERLSTRGIIGGYPCGGPFEPCIAPMDRPYFRPTKPVTRGQLAKITSGAAGYTETPTGQTFADVPPASTFYLWVERLSRRGIIGGYPCGSAGEPCVPPANRPYFRPFDDVTRGQTAKIIANSFFPNCQTPLT